MEKQMRELLERSFKGNEVIAYIESLEMDNMLLTKENKALTLEGELKCELNQKLKKALDNAIKECCINVTGSDACNSLEECEKALQSAQEKTTEVEDYTSIPKSTYCCIEEELNVFKQLTKEHFELVENYNKLTDLNNMSEHQLLVFNTLANAQIKDRKCDLCLYKIGNDIQAYKFEQLKEGMWVWDNLNKDCRQIARVNEYGGIYWYGSLSEYESDKFEENRFYPVTKAMQYQEELLSRKEDNNE